MEESFELFQIDSEKVKKFIQSLKSTNWLLRADENTLDSLFDCALYVQEMFQGNFITKNTGKFVTEYPDIKFERALVLVMEFIIKNSYLNQNLTAYAIKKYCEINSHSNFGKLLENMLTELRLRCHVGKLIEELSSEIVLDCEDEKNSPEIETENFNWKKINSLINDMVNGLHLESNNKVCNLLKTQTRLYLNAVKHGSQLNGQVLLEKMIECLESQNDLRLWFLIMRDENIDIVLDLCDKYDIFLQSVFKFFDKFSDEVESTYDEDLNIKYCHVNLDFEDFLKMFEMFLKRKSLNKVVDNYLNNKISEMKKNFDFWIDVKACL